MAFYVIFGHITVRIDGWKCPHDHLLHKMSFTTVQKETTVLHAVCKSLSHILRVLVLNLFSGPALVQVTYNVILDSTDSDCKLR